MICQNCNEDITGGGEACPYCGNPAAIYDPPDGFEFDPSSGLYYNSAIGSDPDTGDVVQWVTWFDPSTGEYQQESYAVQGSGDEGDEQYTVDSVEYTNGRDEGYEQYTVDSVEYTNGGDGDFGGFEDRGQRIEDRGERTGYEEARGSGGKKVAVIVAVAVVVLLGLAVGGHFLEFYTLPLLPERTQESASLLETAGVGADASEPDDTTLPDATPSPSATATPGNAASPTPTPTPAPTPTTEETPEPPEPEPDPEELYRLEAENYVSMAYSHKDGGEYELSVAAFEKAMEMLPERDDLFEDYMDVLESAVSQLPGSDDLREKFKSLVFGLIMQSANDPHEVAKLYKKVMNFYIADDGVLSLSYNALKEINDYEGLLQILARFLFFSPDNTELEQEILDVIIAAREANYRFSGYSVYYGERDERGRRSGYGVGAHRSYGVYQGQWSNDLANGRGKRTHRLVLNGGTIDYYESGPYRDGLGNGEFEEYAVYTLTASQDGVTTSSYTLVDGLAQGTLYVTDRRDYTGGVTVNYVIQMVNGRPQKQHNPFTGNNDDAVATLSNGQVFWMNYSLSQWRKYEIG